MTQDNIINLSDHVSGGFSTGTGLMLAGGFASTHLVIAELVRISLADRSIEYLDGYSPDEAARKFWEAITGEYNRMKAENEELKRLRSEGTI